ncbi:uncharacterized protein N7484_002940, partial [Penicillium longicatenatum]|uniref:uncharacterized protein n=1 Tax=Penicillium longicatenatum TaxID=1561947 RepID=UPI0025492155
MPASPGTAGKPEKGTMSSRLLTMKFMQRAAATAASKEAQSPASDENTRTPKRQRQSLEHQSPSTPQADLDAIAAAIAAEEQKRQEVIARQAAEAGETHWVLDVPAAKSPSPQPQSFVMATESLDADDDLSFGGRRGFGNFKRKEPPPTTEEGKIREQLENLPHDDPRRVQALAAMEELKKAKAQEARAPKLSEITSISGSGGRPQLMGAPSSKKKKKRKSG